MKKIEQVPRQLCHGARLNYKLTRQVLRFLMSTTQYRKLTQYTETSLQDENNGKSKRFMLI